MRNDRHPTSVRGDVGGGVGGGVGGDGGGGFGGDGGGGVGGGVGGRDGRVTSEKVADIFLCSFLSNPLLDMLHILLQSIMFPLQS